MCRLFGFRSVIPSQVHRSLLAAENALGVQSNRHPDGWGVAYYVEGTPHLTRSPTAALGDQLFQRVSGVVASETVLAHVRKATIGPKTVLNCHPFQYGRWVFAHNGELTEFERHRESLLAEVAPRLRRFILGETDSEVLFFLFLTQLSWYGPLSSRHGVEVAASALRAAIELARRRCDTPEKPSLLTVIATDGTTMISTQGGKELFWSSYKTRCADREGCPSLAPECEAPTVTGFINHLIFSSEPLGGENIWNEMARDEMIGVDWRMRLHREDGPAKAPEKLAV
jgi:glutamine amidotransferase